MLKTLGPIGCNAPHYAIDHFEEQPRYWLEGHPRFANLAGEWFIDEEFNELVVVAGKEADPPRVVMPILEQLLIATGSLENPIANLRLQRLTFSHTRFPMPEGGFAAGRPPYMSVVRPTERVPIHSECCLAPPSRSTTRWNARLIHAGFKA